MPSGDADDVSDGVESKPALFDADTDGMADGVCEILFDRLVDGLEVPVRLADCDRDSDTDALAEVDTDGVGELLFDDDGVLLGVALCVDDALSETDADWLTLADRLALALLDIDVLAVAD